MYIRWNKKCWLKRYSRHDGISTIIYTIQKLSVIFFSINKGFFKRLKCVFSKRGTGVGVTFLNMETPIDFPLTIKIFMVLLEGLCPFRKGLTKLTSCLTLERALALTQIPVNYTISFFVPRGLKQFITQKN